MRWEIKTFERGKICEDIRREGGEMVEMKTCERKEVERRNKGVDRGDYSRLVKEMRPSNTPSSRDSMEFECKDVLKKWLMEWKRMKGGKMKEGGQGMEAIEKTRWKGGKTVGVKRMRTRMKRVMDELKRI